MDYPEHSIHILPQNKKIKAPTGTRLVETLISHGIFLRSDCRGKGRYGKCGTGVVNTVVQLCERGIIEPEWAFAEGKKTYGLVEENKDTDQSAIHISQKDIRSV